MCLTFLGTLTKFILAIFFVAHMFECILTVACFGVFDIVEMFSETVYMCLQDLG